ncbi:MAG: hypothetical protein J1G06_07260 [Oscillospiraceae bacterium]|nr:hypothetical protein [Oscillospiraceae bacterium]
MKKFFTIVISLAVLVIAVYGIAYLVLPMHSMELEEYTHEIGITCDDAYIVREESVYYSTTAGTVYNTVQEGERVSNGAVISNTFTGNVDASYFQKLRTLDSKISRLKKENAGRELYAVDDVSVENEISNKMNSTLSLAASNSVEQIHENREDINGLRAGNEVSASDRIAELENERRRVEASIPARKNETVSDRSGIFSSYVDGLESVLSPDRIKDYSPSYIKSLSAEKPSRANGSAVVVGDPVCRVMNNHYWYVLGISNDNYKDMCKVDVPVSVRFTGISASKVKGTVTYVSEPDENGEYIFLVEVPSYLESAFAYRKIKADIIFEEYSGYKIPIDAVHTGSEINTYYVNAMKGSETYKCDCEVLYTDMAEGYSIIRSTEDAKNKLSSMERLVIGER